MKLAGQGGGRVALPSSPPLTPPKVSTQLSRIITQTLSNVHGYPEVKQYCYNAQPFECKLCQYTCGLILFVKLDYIGAVVYCTI